MSTSAIIPEAFLHAQVCPTNANGAFRMYKFAKAYKQFIRPKGYTRVEMMEMQIEQHLKKNGFYCNLEVLQRFCKPHDGKKSSKMGAKVTRDSMQRALDSAPHAGSATHARIIQEKRALF